MEDYSRIEALLTNKPYKRYIKVTLGRVLVKILDPMTLRETELILSGDPKDKLDTSILDIWTQPEDVYFKRNNKVILSNGLVIEYSEDIDQPDSVNAVSDESLKEVLAGGKFFAVKNLLDKFTSPAPVERMLAIAEEMDKPIKTIQAIKSRLSDLQMLEYENTNLLTNPVDENTE